MENGIVNIASGLHSRGFEMHVACLERRGAFADRLPAPELVEVLGKSGGFSWGATLRLARLISQVRPQVIHSHNLGPLIYSSLATGWGTRLPMVHGEHSQLTDAELTPRRLRQRRWLYRACRQVHTVSDGIRDQLTELRFPRGNISAIPNGVDATRFAPADQQEARAALGLPANAVFIGISGRFGPFKRHDLLIEAFENIAPRFPSARLLIIGGGGPNESSVRERVARSPQQERIHLAGFQRDPVPFYHALDLLAIPSANEGLSNAALEAMACGVPVLANTGCGHEQAITSESDGVIADLHTSASLAAALAALLAEPDKLAKFGHAARLKVEKHFSLAAMIDAYERLYRAAAAAPCR